jgi:hypothetical protein
MQIDKQISSGQLKRLQVLYGQLCRHTDQRADRESRLIWASGLVERPITSFSDLTQNDARHLIDTLQGQLGISESERPRRRRRLSRDAAYAAGTEGRRGNQSKSSTMVSPADLARIQYALDQLGWTQAQLEAWLRSDRSPLGKRATPEIRTLGDANRVWWALKRMIDAHKRRA